MKKVLLVSLVGVVLLLLTGCGGGGGGTPSPTVNFSCSINTDAPGWPGSLLPNRVHTTISNEAAKIEFYSGTLEMDLVFTPDLSEQMALCGLTNANLCYIALASSSGNIGTIKISNLKYSSTRVSGSFKFTTDTLIDPTTMITYPSAYSLSVQGSFDVPAGDWVLGTNGQWQQQKEATEASIFDKINKTK